MQAGVGPSDPVHLGPLEELSQLHNLLLAGRSLYRPRSARLTEHHMEPDEICIIVQCEAYAGELLVRLICRQMFNFQCWVSAVGAGPTDDQARTVTCPNCQGRGHVIGCWRYIDTSITTRLTHVQGQKLRTCRLS